MRIAGWILLVAGLCLCASLAWAAVGFLLMGIGLISLQIAERKRRRAMNSAPPGAETPGMRQEPVVAAAPAMYPAESVIIRPNPGVSCYDKEAWRRLVAEDSDLLHLTSILADYGQQYVDEMAKSYLALVDKKRLPAIVEAIIATAQESPHRMSAPRADQRPLTSTRAPIVVSSEPRHDRPATGSSTFATTLLSKAEDPSGAAVEEPSIGITAEETLVGPERSQQRRNTTITSADDDLAEMVSKFAQG